ncbi:MAG TPA: hypothetical protein VGN69_11150, partial [Solirubrobacteraceae bacterium]|nr:hypothetical protein [Solirubrobacteraceae bacterium]
MDSRLRRILVAATALMVALLVVFAVELANAQQQARQDVEKRFHDRAQVSAYLTESLFQLSATNLEQQAAKQFGGPTISVAKLVKQARINQQPYTLVLDQRGHVLASTPGAPRPTGVPSYVQAALRGASGLSDVKPYPADHGVSEWALPFKAASGTRVLLSGISETALAQFLAGFLAKVPNVSGAASLVVDSQGVLLGGTGMGTEHPGQR